MQHDLRDRIIASLTQDVDDLREEVTRLQAELEIANVCRNALEEAYERGAA